MDSYCIPSGRSHLSGKNEALIDVGRIAEWLASVAENKWFGKLS